MLFVGIDVGKASHVAGFVSSQLLARHKRFEVCPTLSFANSRTGFDSLVECMRSYASIDQCVIILEHTGHYHKAIEQYLHELDVPVYVVHVQKRPKSMVKSDKRDALLLANLLYSQVVLGVQFADASQQARRLSPPTPIAILLRGLVVYRSDLVIEAARRKNKLVAICDQVFPELVEICKDPVGISALAIRDAYPTPQLLANAPLADLLACRPWRYPSKAALIRLQQLARCSIGIKDPVRLHVLVFEQQLLIAGLRLLQSQAEQIRG